RIGSRSGRGHPPPPPRPRCRSPGAARADRRASAAPPRPPRAPPRRAAARRDRPSSAVEGTTGVSRGDGRDDLAREPFEALARREIAKPQHELATAGIDERLHLL